MYTKRLSLSQSLESAYWSNNLSSPLIFMNLEVTSDKKRVPVTKLYNHHIGNQIITFHSKYSTNKVLFDLIINNKHKQFQLPLKTSDLSLES